MPEETKLPNAPRLLSRKKASKILDLSIATLKRWEKKGRLKPHKLPSGHVRYDSRDLEALLK